MAKPNPTAESIFKPSDSLRDYAGAINIKPDRSVTDQYCLSATDSELGSFAI